MFKNKSSLSGASCLSFADSGFPGSVLPFEVVSYQFVEDLVVKYVGVGILSRASPARSHNVLVSCVHGTLEGQELGCTNSHSCVERGELLHVGVTFLSVISWKSESFHHSFCEGTDELHLFFFADSLEV